ncbi:hypothetical protein GCM10022224_017590 [Nonomuraea antimicrobica]|uniref:Ricin B lectin domain-containing protein n=1 Tax=Nonomuraea antimicrobica TaxID=561173 RepID=A0ABP7BAS6_9ACTN
MNNILRKASIAMAAGSAAIATSLAGTAPANAATTFELRPYNGAYDLCLAIENGSMANGSYAIQWECTGNRSQFWYWAGNGELRNRKSDKCLAIGGASLAAGARAIQWKCNGGLEQKWKVISMGSGNGWGLLNENSDMYLAVARSSLSKGAPVIQWHSNTNMDQNWMQRAVPVS